MRFSKRQRSSDAARATYTSMLAKEIAPTLRTLGLKGSGTTYQLPNDTFWALLGFQKSRWNTAGDVRFTVDLTAVPRNVWTRPREMWPEQLAARPSANMNAGGLIGEDDRASYSWQRIGGLTPAGTDRWWEITAETDVEDVADEVVGAIRRYAMPALQGRLGAVAD